MLTSLLINNFALIDHLKVELNSGLTIITGETGAGKSILLGGLSLVLGKRADLNQVKDKNKKCIVEAVFNISDYNLKTLFTSLEMDYEQVTIIRREIWPSGKSRAFVNDSPVTLDTLSKLSAFLIDIHSQHQTQELMSEAYQFRIIDALSNNNELLSTYSSKLSEWKDLTSELDQLKVRRASLIKEYDYNSFLYKELTEIDLDHLDIDQLEEEFKALNNLETIKEKLAQVQSLLTTEEQGTLDQLQNIKQQLSHISEYGKDYELLSSRVESMVIEMNDILSEIDQLEAVLIADPRALSLIGDKLERLNSLFHKHNCNSVEKLIEIKTQLQAKIDNTEDFENQIETKTKLQDALINELMEIATKISDNRKKVVSKLVSKLELLLKDLGMPNARFKIEILKGKDLKSNGIDKIEFLFTANKGSQFSPLKSAASGGELSRIILSLKSILADYVRLPSIIFDEVDTGVSGEIAHKMGDIMKDMSQRRQVITITHLPQIAAKGLTHLKVFKQDSGNETFTNLKQLSEEQRQLEIAQMLGGQEVSQSAMAHAKQLLS